MREQPSTRHQQLLRGLPEVELGPRRLLAPGDPRDPDRTDPDRTPPPVQGAADAQQVWQRVWRPDKSGQGAIDPRTPWVDEPTAREPAMGSQEAASRHADGTWSDDEWLDEQDQAWSGRRAEQDQAWSGRRAEQVASGRPQPRADHAQAWQGTPAPGQAQDASLGDDLGADASPVSQEHAGSKRGGALLARTKVFVVRHLGALGLVAVVALLFTGYQLMSASGGQAPLASQQDQSGRVAPGQQGTASDQRNGGPGGRADPTQVGSSQAGSSQGGSTQGGATQRGATQGGATQGGASQQPGTQRDSGGPTPAATIMVHVTGAVHRPGVVSLPSGARVNDALSAAGGLLPRAVLGSLNLAAVVSDGMQIRISDKAGRDSELVGSQPRTDQAPGNQAAGDRGGADQRSQNPGPDSGPGATGGQVNLNTATQQQLEALPGVGPVTASDIIAFRTKQGRFTSVEQLQEVSGIGAKTFEKIKPHVTI